MKPYLVSISSAIALLTFSQLAFSQSGSEGNFGIHNNTDNNIVIGFYTNDGAGWSTNWLSEDLVPQATAEASFNAESGACEQLIQVGWLGEGDSEVWDEPISIDVCEVNNVYLDDNEIYFD